ncbi:MAG: hypothetical protein EOO62_14275 [Hymenobacter sp.]|nr:MAG: hypothetical protein EOO62_14275 [Hymenobacter sp.]
MALWLLVGVAAAQNLGRLLGPGTQPLEGMAVVEQSSPFSVPTDAQARYALIPTRKAPCLRPGNGW